MSILSINKIKKILPHRYPFLLIDRVVAFKSGEYLVAVKNISINEPYFQGHFPQEPIMPGVLIIEAMAQATALYGDMASKDGMNEENLYYLVGIDKARFRQTVGPGDQMTVRVDFDTVRRSIWKFSATATVEEKLVASADLMTTVAEART